MLDSVSFLIIHLFCTTILSSLIFLHVSEKRHALPSTPFLEIFYTFLFPEALQDMDTTQIH